MQVDENTHEFVVLATHADAQALFIQRAQASAHDSMDARCLRRLRVCAYCLEVKYAIVSALPERAVLLAVDWPAPIVREAIEHLVETEGFAVTPLPSQAGDAAAGLTARFGVVW